MMKTSLQASVCMQMHSIFTANFYRMVNLCFVFKVEFKIVEYLNKMIFSKILLGTRVYFHCMGTRWTKNFYKL